MLEIKYLLEKVLKEQFDKDWEVKTEY
jgi:hypothetical protein